MCRPLPGGVGFQPAQKLKHQSSRHCGASAAQVNSADDQQGELDILGRICSFLFMSIPDFLDDGHLPMGVHKAIEAEVAIRFGSANNLRQKMMVDLSKWLALARIVNAPRFLVDGSFATAKDYPNDIDCVVLVPPDFDVQVQWGRMEAMKLYQAARSRLPAELFIAPNVEAWHDWVAFFSGTRQLGARKGIIEVIL